MTDPALSIVVVTWNSRALLERCLAALPAATAGLATEVIVVDNGSRDGTAELLDAAVRSDGAAPGVAGPRELVVIRNGTNRGVAPARNQGLRRARGALVALLDVDTVPAPGAFVVLADELRRVPRAGLVGPKLVGVDGALQYSCRRFPSLLDKIGRRLPDRLGRALTEDVELRSWDHGSVRAVDYVIGACQVMRAAALAEVGLLDERIFYGPEDVDLCLRLQRAGWTVLYVPSAVVMHLERRVTRKLWSVLTVRHLQGVAYYFWKHGYLFRRPRIVLDAAADAATLPSTEPARPRATERPRVVERVR